MVITIAIIIDFFVKKKAIIINNHLTEQCAFIKTETKVFIKQA